MGGFAVSARAEPRFTRDVDVAVAVADDSEAELLVRDLLGAGYHLSASVEQEATGRLATARLVSMPVRAAEQVIVDVLFASSGIEPEIVAAADTIEIIPELTLPVATIGHLMALKVLARDDETRPQDLADLRALLSVATHEDVDQARSAVRLITKRGFHRNRDLAGALDELVR
ncbi:MAG: nucleotidyl transferase AbiEii/AbiGii toxin family protein [Sciscionella sp.]|nr:nucleotidyl transferase AbiEii/AbiGii toxin family protein [Sciscionella sp.]